MFVQLIKGKLEDNDRLQRAVERWESELAPGAAGWLGSTAGVTGDGTAIAVVRFESEQAAQANSDRPEQGEWWAEASQAFDGDISFQNSSEVDVDTPGDPADAGFVQIMEGHGTDPDRARELMARDADAWAAFRPDLLGSLVIHQGVGQFTMVMYFSSEAAAREGEQKDVPEQLKSTMDEMNTLMTGPPTFYDLKDPWLAAP